MGKNIASYKLYSWLMTMTCSNLSLLFIFLCWNWGFMVANTLKTLPMQLNMNEWKKYDTDEYTFWEVKAVLKYFPLILEWGAI